MPNSKTSPTLHQLQSTVHAWISQWKEGYFSPLSNLARLTEEVGELARAINHQHGDKPPKADEGREDIEEELADILFVVIAIANSLDISLDDAVEKSLEKYNLRDGNRFTPVESS